MNENSDGRRRLFSKRKIKSLEQDRALLIRLVENLHDSNETGLTKTIQIIREGASLATLQLHLAECPGLDLAVEPAVARIEVNLGETTDLARDPRRAYLNIKNIIE
jgi:hypothetical protein